MKRQVTWDESFGIDAVMAIGAAGKRRALVARSGPVDAVVAADTPMLVLAAATAARMGLPHNRVEAVRAATDKATQRRRWAAAGVAQPAFQIVPADASGAAVRQAAARVGLPCVVKAVSLSGSQGVLRVDDQAGAVVAARADPADSAGGGTAGG